MEEKEIKELRSDVLKYLILSIVSGIALYFISRLCGNFIADRDPGIITDIVLLTSILSRIGVYISGALAICLLVGVFYLGSSLQYKNMDEE